MLMDMCSKFFSSIMTARAFKLLDKHGTRFQFGGTPELGCRDGLFTLKALLNARRNHDLASNAKENMSIFSTHFHKVLNNHRPVDDSVLELIPQKPCLTDIDAPITFREVKCAITKLKKGKAPGLNGIPPEALKAMDNAPKRTVHKHISDFFEGKTDHKAWKRSQ